MAGFLKIGEVAKQTGVGVDAIRFYERRGVLPRASRRLSGYRQFTDATVQRIQFARKLQALGFTLDEVVELLAAVDAGVATCESERFRVQVVLGRVDEKISNLVRLRRELSRTLSLCLDGRCSLLEADPGSGRSASIASRPRPPREPTSSTPRKRVAPTVSPQTASPGRLQHQPRRRRASR